MLVMHIYIHIHIQYYRQIKVLTVLSGVLFFPQKRPKYDQLWVIFWIVGTVSCGRLQEVSKST